MTENTTTTRPAAAHAYFGYRNAPAALSWLEQAFGFETTMRFDDTDGTIAHAELRRQDVAIIVFADRDGYQRPPRKGDTGGSGLYLSMATPEEIDAIHARAVAAGAVSVWTPEWTDWGNYRCRVLDPEGFEWSFGVHRPGEPAPEWSE